MSVSIAWTEITSAEENDIAPGTVTSRRSVEVGNKYGVTVEKFGDIFAIKSTINIQRTSAVAVHYFSNSNWTDIDRSF